MGEFQKDERLELIYEDGRPWYFKQKDIGGDHLSVLDSYLCDTKHASGYSSPSTSFSSDTDNWSTPNSLSPRLASVNDASYEKDSLYGKRLIPQIMDQLASDYPDRVVFSLASFEYRQLGFKDITARQFTQAVDKTAWWLRDTLGSPESIQPIGYIGPRKSLSSNLSIKYLHL